MADPLAPYRWVDRPENVLEEVFSVSFFRGLTPSEVLFRFAAPDAAGEEVAFPELWDLGDEHPLESEGGHVGVVQANGWSVAVELGGWTAVETGHASDLSRGCEMVAVLRHDHATDRFVYAVDGEVVTGFVPPWPLGGWGSDPGRLNEAMHRLGMPTARPVDDGAADALFRRLHRDKIALTFALAAEITGVPFTRDLTGFPFLAAPVRGR
ncbi:DUF6461 domain-containing protein [Actinomadura sp. WMMB 499]|uniref:DUF6461 domain-containing protein n=1 Tax=Actinomadura sp. WMMB 499 TaxID=1219491 RepID=UPI0012454F74|nr:DUF6461 domain-containing protein [Actinomadura sp. WMMB 499]QFG23378.1 hypothetical protein F7P10_21940 [Actinomadura sp. WMMB 499]